MGFDPISLIALGGIGLGAVGTGVNYFGQRQAASNASNLASYNSEVQLMNAKQQQQAALAQAAMFGAQATTQRQEAQWNFQASNAEAQAQENNAQTLRNQADAQTAADRNNILRTEQQQAQFTSAQRVAIASSGVVESGSPLEQLASTAGLQQQQLNEMQYQSDLGRKEGYGKAALQDYGAELTKAGASVSNQAGIAQANLLNTQGTLEGAKGASLYRLGQLQSNMTLAQGQADAQGHNLSAFGGLFSGIGQMGQQWTSWSHAYGGGGFGGSSSPMSLGVGGKSIGAIPSSLYG